MERLIILQLNSIYFVVIYINKQYHFKTTFQNVFIPVPDGNSNERNKRKHGDHHKCRSLITETRGKLEGKCIPICLINILQETENKQ